MSFKQSTITHSAGSPGLKTWTLGWQAEWFELVVALAPGAPSTVFRLSTGTTDGTVHVVDTLSEDSTRRYQERFTDRIATISEWNGTAWAEVYKITFDSITATEVKYNVVTGNSAFQVTRKAGN